MGLFDGGLYGSILDVPVAQYDALGGRVDPLARGLPGGPPAGSIFDPRPGETAKEQAIRLLLSAAGGRQVEQGARAVDAARSGDMMGVAGNVVPLAMALAPLVLGIPAGAAAGELGGAAAEPLLASRGAMVYNP